MAGRALSWVNIVVGVVIVGLSLLSTDMALFVPNLVAGILLVVAGAYLAWAGPRLSPRARGGLEALCALVGLGVAFAWLASGENLSLRALFIGLGLVALVVGALGAWRALSNPPPAAPEPTAQPKGTRWLTWTLVVVVVLALLYGGFVAFASNSNGTDVTVVLHLGTNANGSSATTMYMKCDVPASTPGACSGGDQATVTVHQRDRIHLTIVNDDKGDHSHDFNVQGWQYAFPPISPEMELHAQAQSWTFTAWASGSFKMLCEVPGHDGAGMHGELVVQ